MPRMPTIVVPLDLDTRNLILKAIAAGIETGKLQVNVENLNKSLQTVGTSAGRGFGQMMLMMRGVNMLTGAMRSGIQQAVDTDFALNSLNMHLGLVGEQARKTKEALEDVTMAIGPLNMQQVIQSVDMLADSFGATHARVMALMPTFEKFVSNVVSLSQGAIDPRGATLLGVHALNVFGGMTTSTAEQRNLLELMHKYISTFAKYEPQQWGTILQRIAVVAQGLNIGPEQIMQLATSVFIAPTTSRGGTQMRALLGALSTIPRGHGAMSKETLAARFSLGMDISPGVPRILDKGNMMDVLASISQHMAAFPDTLAGRTARQKALQAAVPSKLAQQEMIALGTDPRRMEQLRDQTKLLSSIDNTLKQIQETPYGKFEQLKTNLGTLASDVFIEPAKRLGQMSDILNAFMRRTMHQERDSPGFLANYGWGISLLALGGLAGVGGAFGVGGAIGLGMTTLLPIITALGLGIGGYLIGKNLGLTGRPLLHAGFDRLGARAHGAGEVIWEGIVNAMLHALRARGPQMQVVAAFEDFFLKAIELTRLYIRGLLATVHLGWLLSEDPAAPAWDPHRGVPWANPSPWPDQPGDPRAAPGGGGKRMPDTHREALTQRKVGEWWAHTMAPIFAQASNSSSMGPGSIHDPYVFTPTR